MSKYVGKHLQTPKIRGFTRKAKLISVNFYIKNFLIKGEILKFVC
jgi:hypothetical protein